ncbi:MAG: FIST N-terminal domain-containing protein [Phycisphaerales bacterium]
MPPTDDALPPDHVASGPPPGGRRTGHRAASSISEHLDTRTAATEVAGRIHDDLAAPCDLVLVFASFHHAAALPQAMESFRTTLDPGTLVAVTTESSVGPDRELEGLPGLSAVAMHLPGVRCTSWTGVPDVPVPISRPDEIPAHIHLEDDSRGIFLFGDPFSTPITRLLPALSTAVSDRTAPGAVPILGGMASGASQPGHNVMVLNDQVIAAGAIGVTLAGDVQVDAIVSQGCRPIAEPLVITKTDGQVILELAGRRAVDVVQETTRALPEHERQLLSKGLLIGHVIDETRRPFGRGDFLVRSIVGVDKQRGGVVAADPIRPGQTVQLHARDAVTAGEDLQLLLDAQQLHERPFAGALFTCNGRGERLFGEPNHDVGIIQRRIGPLPMAGFMAAGEIGPIGGRSFLHGHTAVLALLRAGPPESIQADAEQIEATPPVEVAPLTPPAGFAEIEVDVDAAGDPLPPSPDPVVPNPLAPPKPAAPPEPEPLA